MPTAKKPVPVRPVDHDAIRVMMVEVFGEVVDSRLADLREAVHEIKLALTGNGFGAQHGLIERMANVEKAQQTLAQNAEKDIEALRAEFHAFRQEQRDAWAKIKWTFTGIGMGAGLSGGGIVYAAVKLLGGG